MEIPHTVDYHSLKGKVAVITGSGQGIGRVYAHHFAAQGAIPVIAEVNAERGAAVAGEIEEAGGKTLFVETDVSDEASTLAMADAALKAFGRIDILINNAAMFTNLSRGAFWELSLDEWNRTLAVNVTGPLLAARACTPSMKERNWGRVINISSGTMSIGHPNFMHYVASKAAVIGMTRSMARELGPWNITVNTFWPGLTRTEITGARGDLGRYDKQIEMQCLKRECEPEDHARIMLFLCSDESTWVNGHNIASDGGYKFL